MTDQRSPLPAFPRAFAFVIPWIPISKKNDVRAVTCRTRDGRSFVRPVSGDSTVRQEHAIGVLFNTHRAHNDGQIDDRVFDRLRSACVRRAFPGNGMGKKGLESVVSDAQLAQREPAFGAHDVEMRITIHVGRTQERDRVDVEIVDLGRPLKRRRTGKKRDAINVIALVADALNRNAYKDDAQVVALRLRMAYDEDRDSSEG